MVAGTVTSGVTSPQKTSAATLVRFDRLLFPTDFSSASQRALSFAAQIATSYHSHVYILHQLEECPATSETISDFMPHLYETSRYEAEKHLRRLENSGELAQIQHSIFLDSGPLESVIETTVRHRQVDLVVISTHGRDGMRKVLLGSVAESVSLKSKCPVLVVGPHVQPTSRGSTFRRVLCATEFLDRERNSVRYAASIAQHYSAELTILYVCRFLEPPPLVGTEDSVSDKTEQLYAALVGDLHLTPAPTFVVRVGVVSDTIMQTAGDSKTDLIVMGVHSAHAHAAATHNPWNITHRVICHVNCPVLTVPD